MVDVQPILVIDDEEIVLMSVNKILSGEGYRVETTTSPVEAMDKLKQKQYSMVITDLKMPDMSGLDVIETVKQDFPAMPVLMITGYASVKTAIEALRSGAMDYFAKPFRRQELIGAVHRAIRRAGEDANKDGDTADKVSVKNDTSALSGPLLPGAKFVLPGHSWALYEQEGTIIIGLQPDFLRSVGSLTGIACPEINSLIEQGFDCIELINTFQEEHHVYAPIGGRVVGINDLAVKTPAAIAPNTWIIRIVPSNLTEELAQLKRVSG